MSRKSDRIAKMVKPFGDERYDPHYLGYFDLFNRQKFYEAHDVLEHIWLQDKHGLNGAFYKGLIQLAGAFVHLQKDRRRPAAALFKLAQANLEKYPGRHECLDITATLAMIQEWLSRLESKDFAENPLTPTNAPQMNLVPPAG